MICLFCKTEISGDPPLECPECEFTHQSRPPVVGVNHMSQLLCGLDLLAENEIETEDFEAIFDSFVEFVENLEQKWKLRESLLSERLSSGLKAKFFKPFQQLDEALQVGYQGIEMVEAILNGESDGVEEATDSLVSFFQGVCGASAQILDRIDDFDKNKGSGLLFNLPSV